MHAVLVQPDGKVVIGGEFTLVNSVQRLRLARLNTDGSLDTSFNPTLLFNGAVYALAQAPDGKIYFGGSFEDAGGSGRDHFARLNADGSLDTGFNDTGVDDTVRAIALDWDQYRIYIAGDFTMVGGLPPSPAGASLAQRQHQQWLQYRRPPHAFQTEPGTDA